MLTENIFYPLIISFIIVILFRYFNYKSTNKNYIIITLLINLTSLIITYLYLGTKINLFAVVPILIVSSIYIYFTFKEEKEYKALISFFGIIFLFFLGSIFEIIPHSIFKLLNIKMTPIITSIISLIGSFILMFILIFIFRKDLKDKSIAFFKDFNNIFDLSFKYWFTGLVIMIISNLIIGLILGNTVANNEQLVQDSIKSFPIITLISAGFIAPIVEELVFRKNFRSIIKNNLLFVLTSGIVFGALHVVFAFTSLTDLLFIIPYSSLGIAFAYILYKTDNICAPIMMHLIHNTMLIIMSILTSGVL